MFRAHGFSHTPILATHIGHIGDDIFFTSSHWCFQASWSTDNHFVRFWTLNPPTKGEYTAVSYSNVELLCIWFYIQIHTALLRRLLTSQWNVVLSESPFIGCLPCLEDEVRPSQLARVCDECNYGHVVSEYVWRSVFLGGDVKYV